MQWKRMVAISALLCSCAASPSWAQTWTSTFVGDRGLPGSASQSGDEWTVSGGGADVWDRDDAFQFVHQTVQDNGTVTARIDDLQNTDTFAKAGVMVRANLDTGAATAILDVRPGGQLEFMVRSGNGDAITFITSQSATFPIWLRLSWSQGSVRAWSSRDGSNWFFLGNAIVILPATFEAGAAVTSHNETELTTAHVGALAVAPEEVPGWNSTDVGNVELSGNVSETNDVWTVTGAGSDVWGLDDEFHYLYRPAIGQRRSLRVHLKDMQNTSAFAKAGLMIRTSLDPASATVLLDVRPTGDVEFMTRPTDGSAMQYVGGATVTLPIWLELDWVSVDNTFTSPVRVTAKVSSDGTVYTPVGPPSGVTITLPPGPSSYPLASGDLYQVGVFVSSHDANAVNVAHFEGLSLFTQGDAPLDVGNTGLIGNAVNDNTVGDRFIVDGAGADIWGPVDSFHFFAFPPGSPTSGGLSVVHVNIHANNPFAKAGLMIRDGIPVTVSAPMVILDLKPDGGIEFMARVCGGCDVEYLGGANVGAHPWLSLRYSGTTFSAQVMSDDRSQTVDLGSVTVPMSTFLPGFAVTSHDPTQTAVGVFD